MNKKTMMITAVVFIVVLIGAILLYNGLSGGIDDNKDNGISNNNTSNDRDQNQGDETDKVKAPDFTVIDNQGNTVKLSDYAGQPVVVNFWATWCPPCKNEMPHFNEVYLEKGDDVAFLMIDLTDGKRETLEKAKTYITENNYAFPVFYDVDEDAAFAYTITSLPTTIFVDEDGYIVAQAQRAISKEALLQGIALIEQSHKKAVE